jgi:hypothetical protein
MSWLKNAAKAAGAAALVVTAAPTIAAVATTAAPIAMGAAALGLKIHDMNNETNSMRAKRFMSNFD